MNWYYVDAAGQQAGPVDGAGLDGLAASGAVNAETLIWAEGMANWQPLREVRPGAYAPAPVGVPAGGGLSIASGGEEAVCAECGGIFPLNDTIRIGSSRVCAKCKPIFVQKMREGAAIGSGQFAELSYAGFWIRLAAKVVDNIILAFVIMIPLVLLVVVMAGTAASSARGTSAGPNLMFFVFFELGIIGAFLVLPPIYNGFFVGKYAATPGKMLCRLQVVTTDGGKVGYGRAFGRGFAEIVSRMIWGIGYIIAAFDSQKRALHDHICGTRVVYR